VPDPNHPLPTNRQWETAEVAQYVWGNPETVHGYGRAVDTAGHDLASIADGLHGIEVDGFWTGPGATAFLQLRDRVVPAVRGLAAMHTDAAAALDTWQRQLAVYQGDCAAAITTGRGGWSEYEATRAPDGLTAMNTGRTGITRAKDSRDTAAGHCRTAIDAATAKADVPTRQPAGPGQPGQISTVPGQVGQAPSGREPVPAPVPYAPGEYVDPANGRLVRPVPGPWAVGRQPWEYVDGGSPAPFTAQPAGPTNPPQAPSGQAPVPFTGPIPAGQERPMVDPANGRVVVPVTGVYAPGQPWPYVYADGN
jgi:hypothetical protein